MAVIAVDTQAGCGIYKIVNVVNGKIYIGQSVDIRRRWRAHLHLSRCESLRGKPVGPVHLAMKKYGISNFRFELIENCTREELCNREEFWIKQLNTLVPYGYNQVLLDTGRAIFLSEESREKMSESHKGKKPSVETLARRSASLRGKKRTEEVKLKMSLAQMGRKFTDEHKKNLSESHAGKPSNNKGKKMPEEARLKMIASKIGKPAIWRRKGLLRNDGVFFESIMLAAQEIGAHRATLHKHLIGKLKTVHGYTFTRVEV